MKYISKPVEVEAIQFDGTNTRTLEIIEWAGPKGSMWHYSVVDNFCHEIKIETLEGRMSAFKGDWIIKGLEGEFYPCKDSVFKKKYEAV